MFLVSPSRSGRRFWPRHSSIFFSWLEIPFFHLAAKKRFIFPCVQLESFPIHPVEMHMFLLNEMYDSSTLKSFHAIQVVLRQYQFLYEIHSLALPYHIFYISIFYANFLFFNVFINLSIVLFSILRKASTAFQQDPGFKHFFDLAGI